MNIPSFTISAIPRILFGEGRFAEVPGIVRSFGTHVLIVTGARSFTSSANWNILIEGLNDASVTWHTVAVEGEPSPDLVDAAVAEYRAKRIDVVLGIGGGSPIDAAKAIAGLLPFGNSVMDHLEVVGRGIPYTRPALPLIAVPTTAGTGAEATKNAVLSRTGPDGFKRSFRHDSLAPTVAVVDPILTYDCPPELTAASGMDAVTQLIESYVSTGASPFTDTLSLSGLSAAGESLIAAYEAASSSFGSRAPAPLPKPSSSPRSQMSYAALLSGITLAHAGLGVIHGLASPMGGRFPIPHGVICARLLVPGIKASIKALRLRQPDSPALPKYACLGRLLSDPHVSGFPLRSNPETQGQFDISGFECSEAEWKSRNKQDPWNALIETLTSWTDRLHIPRLGAYGVTESDLPAIAAGCSAKTNPVALTEEELVGILREGL